MKRLFILLLVVLTTAPSCGILNMLLGQYPLSDNPVTDAISVIAPNPRNLTPQEDPGTGLYGYLNEYGIWAIAPDFAYAKRFDSDLGMAVVRLKNGYWGAINVFAQTVIEFNFQSSYDVESAMRSMAKGRYRGIDLWVEEDAATGLYGYLDYYGNWYIKPQFRYAGGMSDGYAVVQFHNEMWGAIDRNCNIIVQPNFMSRYDAESALRSLLNR